MLRSIVALFALLSGADAWYCSNTYGIGNCQAYQLLGEAGKWACIADFGCTEHGRRMLEETEDKVKLHNQPTDGRIMIGSLSHFEATEIFREKNITRGTHYDLA